MFSPGMYFKMVEEINHKRLLKSLRDKKACLDVIKRQ